MKLTRKVVLTVLMALAAGGTAVSAAPARPNTLRYSVATEFASSGLDGDPKGQGQTSVRANSGTDPFALGCLAVAWQAGAVQFRMFATGQSSEFTFCVNGTPVQTYPADATGYIGVGAFPAAAPSPLKFRDVSLRNAAD